MRAHRDDRLAADVTFSEEQVMLCLAGLSYRGFDDVGLARPGIQLARAGIERGLVRLAPLRSRFELVWGPASYRGPLSVFDEKLVYVARERAAQRRYVVVIRGTNPVSIWDWLFGDLWTGRDTPWRYGSDGARISLSAGLSLSIVQGLRSPAPPGHAGSWLWRMVEQRLAEARDGSASIKERLRAVATLALGPLQQQLFLLLQTQARIRARMREQAPGAQLAAALQLWKSLLRRALFEVVDRIAERAGAHLDLQLLALIEGDARLRATLGTGSDLRTFLAAAVDEASGPLDVVVVGHSKGGALASTVALWLAESQGTAVAPAERWDPQGRARVHCFSFAGPTSGNRAFAARSDARIGSRCHRLWNALDIVPHAWGADELARVADLYPRPVRREAVVAELVDVLRRRVERFGYTQPGELVTRLPGEVYAGKPSFFEQLAHQHTDAYPNLLGLTVHGISWDTLFKH